MLALDVHLRKKTFRAISDPPKSINRLPGQTPNLLSMLLGATWSRGSQGQTYPSERIAHTRSVRESVLQTARSGSIKLSWMHCPVIM